MKKKIIYFITIIVSLLFIVIGHKVAVNDFNIFQESSQIVVKANVQKIIKREEKNYDLGQMTSVKSIEITFESKVTNGKQKGEILEAIQDLGNSYYNSAKEVSEGDSILLTNLGYDDQWYFMEYVRTDRLLLLGIFFIVGVLVFGGKKGFNTILSLCFTCAAIFAIFVPAILSGKNIYLCSILVCLYTVIMTFLIVHGLNKKSLAATIGCFSGIAITGIITMIADKVLSLTGMLDEQSIYLTMLPIENPINLRAIIFAGIIIGAMGAIMDISMSIASSLWEIKENSKEITLKSLLKSGIIIGQDMMGTMASTLILAYIGGSLSIVLLLSVYSNSLLALLNMEMIIVEILQAIVGSLGILFTMPLTSFICSVLYFKKDRKNKKTIED